jgi:transcriptional regulator with XRE-family HTH domain
MSFQRAKETERRSSKKDGNHPRAKNLTGLRIRMFREKRGWCQRELAEALSEIGVPITRDIIANIETQRCPVTDYQVVFFARILGVSWKSLFPDKSSLINLTAPPASEECPRSGAKKNRHPQNSSCKAPQRNLNVYEITCKSVKISFRGPS